MAVKATSTLRPPAIEKDLICRLSLPLAQLCRLAHNAKTTAYECRPSASEHLNGFAFLGNARVTGVKLGFDSGHDRFGRPEQCPAG